MSGFTYSEWSKGATPPPGFTVYGSDLPAPDPAPYEPPPRAPRRRSGGGALRRFLGFVVIALVLGGVRYGIAEGIDRARGVRRFPYGTTLHTPATIGSIPRLNTAEARRYERTVEANTPKDSSPQAAMYGRGTKATYWLFAALSGERSSHEVYSEVSKGLTADTGNMAEFAPGKSMPGGVHCGRVRLSDQHGAACAWSSDLSNGFLIDVTHPDLAALAKRTLVVIDQVNGER